MKLSYILVMTIAAAVAQTPPDAGPGIGQAMKQNGEALKHYTYKRRTEVKVKDRSRARVELVRYVDGKMETVPLETPARPPEAGRARGLRGRMVEKKKEEMKEDVERLTSLLHSYVPAGAEGTGKLMEKATISRVGTGPDADVKVVATGVVKPADSFTLIWSVVQKRPLKVEIAAALEGKPVRVTVDYAALPGGPFYAARTVVSAPKKDLTVTIDTFEYTDSSSSK